MSETANQEPSAEPAPSPATVPMRAHHERVVVIPTRLYWTALLLSVLFIALAVGFYREYTGTPGRVLEYATLLIAFIVLAWSLFGLMIRGRVVQRTARGTKRLVTGMAQRVEASSEAHEGAFERFIDRWRNRIVNLFLFFWKLVFRWPFLLIRWAWYTLEKTVWRLLLLLYDILYYPLYAAYRTARWAVLTAVRIVWWALGVLWKVPKQFTKLPIIKPWWRTKQRPKILANWRRTVKHWEHRQAMRIEAGRRRAALRGDDADYWERDFRQRKGFWLPNPEKARVAIRRRITLILEVERARKEGRPVPKRKKHVQHPEAAAAAPTEDPAESLDERGEESTQETPVKKGKGPARRFRSLLKDSPGDANEGDSSAEA